MNGEQKKLRFIVIEIRLLHGSLQNLAGNSQKASFLPEIFVFSILMNLNCAKKLFE